MPRALVNHRLVPPTKRDPNCIHGAIWEQTANEPFLPPRDKPLTLAAYECGLTTRDYVETVAVGDALPDMPLYLEPESYVRVPLQATYNAAWQVFPERWRGVLAPRAP